MKWILDMIALNSSQRVANCDNKQLNLTATTLTGIKHFDKKRSLRTSNRG